MEDQWAQVITTIAALIALLFAFAKWFMDWAEKRDEAQELHFKQRLDSHVDEFAKLHERLNKHERELSCTRERLLTEYFKSSDANGFRSEMKEDFSEIKRDINSVHERVGAVSRELNHLIGKVEGRRARGE